MTTIVTLWPARDPHLTFVFLLAVFVGRAESAEVWWEEHSNKAAPVSDARGRRVGLQPMVSEVSCSSEGGRTSYAQHGLI